MGNCLVTKLKGSVDNPRLLKLGEMRIPFGPVNRERYFTIEGSAYTVYDSAGNVLPSSGSIPANTEGYITIVNKYNLINLTFSDFRGDSKHTINIEDVKYSSNLLVFYSPESDGNIEDLPSSLLYLQLTNAAKLSGTFIGRNHPHLVEFGLSYGNTAVHVNLSEFAETEIFNTQLDGDASLVTGDISDLTTKVSFLHIGSAPGITGNLNTFCDRIYASGKHSGNLTYIPNGVVTKTSDTPTISDQYIVDFTESGWHNRTA